MAEPRNAEQILWDAPGGVQMALLPQPGGSLLVEVGNGVVTITGTQCRHLQGEDARKPKEVGHQILAEVQMTLLTDRCQITWKCVAAAEKKRD
jgi:hypothetical protein